jgi:hypothetical protein
MNLLCPACRTPLPGIGPVVTCAECGAEVDLTRAATAAGRPRFVPEPDRSGREVGGYKLGARLGGGGMGTVYRAEASGGGTVAVKFLSPALAGSPELVARFGREVKVLAGLQHEAIVRVLAHGEDDGVPWFAMELVDGEDLRARLQRGPLAIEEARALFGRLLAALGHAHARGIVHRDLKPANVLLATSGAKLADFGVARWDGESLTGPRAATRLTETAAVIGTLAYMSPEQRRGAAVDGRSDLFSVGVMLYEAVTGSLPLGAFPMPSAARPGCPRALDRVVRDLLAPDPARRPASAAEAAHALDLALRPSRSRLVAGGTAAAAAAVAAVVASLGGSGGMKRLGIGEAQQRQKAEKPTLAAQAPPRLPPPLAFDAGAPPVAQPLPTQKLLGPKEKKKGPRTSQRGGSGGKPTPASVAPKKAAKAELLDEKSLEVPTQAAMTKDRPAPQLKENQANTNPFEDNVQSPPRDVPNQVPSFPRKQ